MDCVKNINTGAANWAIQFGKSGEERSEILLITSSVPSGTTLLTTGTARFPHPTDTPVYFVKFDQLVFKRSTSGTSGTASAISSGTVSITPDGTVTIFDDTSGATTYGYKASYRNSVTGDLSTDSDWLTPAGFDFYALARLRERVKSKLYSANYLRDDDQVDDWINEWYESMTNAAIDVNQDYSIGTVDVAFGTSGLGTITSSDFKQVRRFEVTYNGTDYYLATKKDGIDYLPSQTFNQTHPYFIYKGDTVFLIKPEAG